MQQAEFPAFQKHLEGVMNYYKQPLSDFVRDVWWEGLRRYPFDSVKAAFSTYMARPSKESHFPPMVSDVALILEGSTTDRAQVAWGKVYEAMGNPGAYGDVVFDDPIVHAVIVDMGGWQKLCHWDTSELNFAISQFTKLYASLSERGVEGYPAVIYGIHSLDYDKRSAKGWEVPEPKFFGDEAKAREVMRLGGAPRVKSTMDKNVAEHLRLGSGLEVHKLSGPKKEGDDGES